MIFGKIGEKDSTFLWNKEKGNLTSVGDVLPPRERINLPSATRIQYNLKKYCVCMVKVDNI